MRVPLRALLACLLLASGCASSRPAVLATGTEEAEVLGVVVERSPSDGTDGAEEADPTERVPTETPPPEVASEPDTGPGQRSGDQDPPEGDPADAGPAPSTDAPPPPRPTAAATTPATASPEPSDVGPLVVGTGDGWSSTSWTVDEGTWVEISARPTITRDDPDGALAWPLRVELADTSPLAAPDATPAPVRRAICRAWFQAHEARTLVARGSVVVTLLLDGVPALSATHGVDLTVAPGERADLPDLGGIAVASGDVTEVTCGVRLE